MLSKVHLKVRKSRMWVSRGVVGEGNVTPPKNSAYAHIAARNTNANAYEPDHPPQRAVVETFRLGQGQTLVAPTRRACRN